MSDTITPEERAHSLLHNPMYHGDPNSVGMEQFISLMEGAIATAIREAEARGEAREREACAEIAGVSLDYAWVHEQILARSRKPTEASETDEMVEGYNGA